MNDGRKKGILTALSVMFLLTAVPLYGQTGGSYDLKWNTSDGGGGESNSGVYTLSGTISQIDASAQRTEGVYAETGGFWAYAYIELFRIMCYKDGNDIRIEWSPEGVHDIYYDTTPGYPEEFFILDTGMSSPYYHLDALSPGEPDYYYDVR